MEIVLIFVVCLLLFFGVCWFVFGLLVFVVFVVVGVCDVLV